jgi:hypothetical protein
MGRYNQKMQSGIVERDPMAFLGLTDLSPFSSSCPKWGGPATPPLYLESLVVSLKLLEVDAIQLPLFSSLDDLKFWTGS